MDTRDQTEMAYSPQGDIVNFVNREGYTLVSIQGCGFAFYDRNANLLSLEEVQESADFLDLAGGKALIGSTGSRSLRLLQLRDQTDSEVFSYDSSLAHLEARVNPEDQTVTLFSSRHLWLFNLQGRLIAEKAIEDHAQLYDIQYRRDGEKSWLELIYNDGRVVSYSVKTLDVLSETRGDIPDPGMEEDFYTDCYRIHKKLNEVPVVYDIVTGEQEYVLDHRDSIAYVTQLGENILIEYVGNQDNLISRYGILMNSRFEELAELPYLCDVVNGELYFDYPSGNIRKCRIYSVEDLIAMAEQ